MQISNNTTLDPGYYYPNSALDLAGDLIVDGGSAIYMDYGGHNMNVPLNIGGSLLLTGNLSGSNTFGSDIYLKGDYTNNGAANNFFPNNRALRFNGAALQNINGTNINGFTFPTW